MGPILGWASIMGVCTLAMTRVCTGQHTTMENVTVWAQKRAASAQDVPASLTTLTADQLDAMGLDHLDGVARAVPSLDMQRSVGPVTTTLRIRRVGNLGNIPTFEPAVGVFVDGAFRSRSMLVTGDLLDVERIEVLNGPQNTLYGKNVSAGVIALYTAEPAGRLSTKAEMTVGAIDASDVARSRKLMLGVSGPVTQSIGGSIAGSHSEHDHTIANALRGYADGNDLDRTSLRGQLLWSAGEKLRVRLLVGHWQENDDRGESDVVLVPGARSSTIAGILRQAHTLPPCADNIAHNRRTCSVATNRLDLRATDATLIGDYRFANGWQLTSTTAWDQFQDVRFEDDLVQLHAPLLYFHDSERGTSAQQELRLASAAASPVQWLAGVFYYQNGYERGSGGRRPMFGPNGSLAFDPVWPTLLGGLPLALPDQHGAHDSHVDTEYYSAYGQLTWPLASKLSLTTGMRWQSEGKQAGIRNSVSLPGRSVVSAVFTPSVSPSGEAVNGTLERTSRYTTWTISPEYRFSNDVMAYAIAARGGKSGGFNTGFGNAPLSAREFADESIDHYELGTRAMLAQRRMRLNVSAFHTRYRDYQDAAFISSQFTVGNASEVSLKGFELDAMALLGSRASMDAAVSLADLTYATNTTGMCYPGRVPDGSLPRSCDLSGEHPIDAPRWAINAGIQYERPLRWGSLFARFDWSWTDDYNTSFSADPRMVQRSHHDIGGRIGTRFGEHYEIVAWGDNLLDEKVAYFDAVLNVFDDRSYQSYLAEPRTFGVTFRARF